MVHTDIWLFLLDVSSPTEVTSVSVSHYSVKVFLFFLPGYLPDRRNIESPFISKFFFVFCHHCLQRESGFSYQVLLTSVTLMTLHNICLHYQLLHTYKQGNKGIDKKPLKCSSVLIYIILDYSII